MYQPNMRLVLTRLEFLRPHTPETFFRQCREKCTVTPSPARLTTRAERLKPYRLCHNIRSLQYNSARKFSTRSSSQLTVVKLNPRADDDGNDMTIEISDSAVKVSLIGLTCHFQTTDWFPETTPDHELTSKA
jgi:hypothetical protein